MPKLEKVHKYFFHDFNVRVQMEGDEFKDLKKCQPVKGIWFYQLDVLR